MKLIILKKPIKKIMIPGLLMIFALFNTESAKACINPDTTIVNVTVEYDTTNAPLINQIVLRLTNMKLMTEAPNKICACALTQWSQMFSNLQYIAFVYAGTNIPYNGFASFNENTFASKAWDSTTTSGSWSGFIATVVNAGLKSTEAVDLIIRASTPSGVFYTLDGDSSKQRLSLINDLLKESLGTDEWNGTTNLLVNAHRGIQGINSAQLNFFAKPIAYFAVLDTTISNNTPTSLNPLILNINGMKLYPNPAITGFKIEFNVDKSQAIEINIYNIEGQIVKTIAKTLYQEGLALIPIHNENGVLGTGTYLVQIKTESGSSYLKLNQL